MAIVKKVQLWTSERGAEVIEFAIILPVLLLVVFGIVDFGFLFQRYVVLTNAAMEGARVAVLPGYSQTDAETRATTYAVDGGIPDAASCPPLCAVAQPASLPGPAPGATWPGWTVTVTYIHTYSYIGPIAELFGGSFSSVTLTARATMRSQVGAAPAP
jgi:Flp pilus assembly protein TadG